MDLGLKIRGFITLVFLEDLKIILMLILLFHSSLEEKRLIGMNYENPHWVNLIFQATLTCFSCLMKLHSRCSKRTKVNRKPEKTNNNTKKRYSIYILMKLSIVSYLLRIETFDRNELQKLPSGLFNIKIQSRELLVYKTEFSLLQTNRSWHSSINPKLFPTGPEDQRRLIKTLKKRNELSLMKQSK